MELKATIIEVLPIVTGQGKNVEWQKQDVIFETSGDYPKKIAVTFWGDKINPDKLKVGNVLNVSLEIESREYDGKWYTNVKGWKYNVLSTSTASASATANEYPDTLEKLTGAQDSDDLPF